MLQGKPALKEITPIVRRQPQEEEELQMKETSSSTTEVSQGLESRLASSEGGGRPLSGSNRDYFERRFGADFSGVRVHTGNDAEQMSLELNAQAFTLGKDIYFGAGRHNPEATEGRKLLAHELTHVVQQLGTNLKSFASLQAGTETQIQLFGERSYDVGSIDVHISRIRHSWDNWPEIQEGGNIYDNIARLIRHRTAPVNVWQLIQRSNLQHIFEHIRETITQMGYASADTEINYEFHRDSAGVVRRITFRAPNYPEFQPETVVGQSISLLDWLQMAIDRLIQGQPEDINSRYRVVLLNVMRVWQAGRLTDGDYLTVRQVDAQRGTVWRGGAHARGSRNIHQIAMKFIDEMSGDSRYGYYMPRYVHAQRVGDDPTRELDGWNRNAGWCVENAWQGLEHLQNFSGEIEGVPLESENRSAILAMMSWRDQRRERPDAFLSYLCQASRACGAGQRLPY